MPQYSNAFVGPNRAEIDRDVYSNALLKNEVARVPQRNRAEDLAIQGDEQTLNQNRSVNARKMAADIFTAIADSPDPIATGAMLTQSQAFRDVGGELRLPVDQFKPGPGDDPEQIRAAARSWAQAVGGGSGNRLENTDIPSNVRVAEYYAGLPEAGQGVTRSIFNEANRAPTVREIAGVQTQLGPGASTQPLGSLDAEAEAKRTLAAAQASGTATGGAQGAAAAGLPDAVADINKMRRDIQGFLSHPGFSTVYGKSRPLAFIPGSEAAGAEGRRRTLDAQAFAITIQKMRGLGALSNAEGQRVTDAFTHATNAQISEEEAQAAWGEVQYYLDLAEQRAQQKAGPSQQSQAMPDFSTLSDQQLLQIINGQ